MTRAEIRARALAQAGEQENALGEMAGVVNQYLDEGQRMLYPCGVCASVQVTVSNGAGSLGTGVLDVVKVKNALGGEETRYAIEDGCLRGLADGSYELLALKEPEGMTADTTECALPAGVQGALADYATWRILSGGGRTQQLRADFYWQRFLIERQRAQRVQEQRMGPRRRVNRYR